METEKNILSIILNNNELFTDFKQYDIIFQNKECKYINAVIHTINEKFGKWNKQAIIDYICEHRDFELIDYYDILELEKDKENFNFYLNDLLIRQINIDLRAYISVKQDKNLYDFKNDVIQILNKNKDIDEKNIEDNKQLCRELVEKLKSDYTQKRIFSGIDFLEEHQSGYETDSFILIGAAESVGKTSFMLDLIIKQLKNDMAIGLISCEMKRKKIFQLIACNLAGLDSNRLDRHCLTAVESERFISAIERLYERPLYIIDDTRDWNIIKNRINILVKEKKVDMIYIDYMQYLRIKDIQKFYDRLEIISGDMKNIAKELDVPLCSVVTLSREGKKDTEPQTYHIKGNGDIEYDADIIILMQTLKNDFNSNDNNRIVNFFLRKNRNGKIGFWKMEFFCDIRRFEKI